MIDKVIALLKVDGIKRGLSILGGEPLADENIPGLAFLLLRVRESLPDCDIWVWTGYTMEDLMNRHSDPLTEKNFYDIINTVNVIYSRNNSLSGSYTSEAKVLVEQAGILDKAAKDAMPSEEDPLLRDIGSIISTKS